ncbi:MAG: DUF2007 domain-containing protein [Candidatus Krumholzibacteria bacterium]|nr:DUF2007 domain-containing protein [Candidatus Krumholzibacteria bacterium]
MPEEKKHGPPDEDDLVELISVQGEANAELLVDILEGEEIDVMLKSNQTFGALPFTVDGMGAVRLLVRAHDLPKARLVLEEYARSVDEMSEALREMLSKWAPRGGKPH